MVFCAVCFGDPTSPLTHGYNLAVIVLLAVTVLVLSAFAVLFHNFHKREKNSLKNRLIN
jgi:hypothetical protein